MVEPENAHARPPNENIKITNAEMDQEMYLLELALVKNKMLLNIANRNKKDAAHK